jgi:cell division protein FtsW (lipid II flippase)
MNTKIVIQIVVIFLTTALAYVSGVFNWHILLNCLAILILLQCVFLYYMTMNEEQKQIMKDYTNDKKE